MLAFMFVSFMYSLLAGGGANLPAAGYFQAAGYSLLFLLALVAISCFPVLIYCYFVKMIPDIDYSIRVAFVVTIVGFIAQFF